MSPDTAQCPSEAKAPQLRATRLSPWKNVTDSVYINLNTVQAVVFYKSTVTHSILPRISAEGCHRTNGDWILAEVMFLLLLRKSVEHLVKKYVLALTAMYCVRCWGCQILWTHFPSCWKYSWKIALSHSPSLMLHWQEKPALPKLTPLYPDSLNPLMPSFPPTHVNQMATLAAELPMGLTKLLPLPHPASFPSLPQMLISKSPPVKHAACWFPSQSLLPGGPNIQ